VTAADLADLTGAIKIDKGTPLPDLVTRYRQSHSFHLRKPVNCAAFYSSEAGTKS
jgi:hypothetical protein